MENPFDTLNNQDGNLTGLEYMGDNIRKVLFQRIIRQRGLDFAGRVMQIIQNILSLESSSPTMFLYWICYLILEPMHHIIFGNGEKKQENSHLYTELIIKPERSLFYVAEVAA